MFPVHVINRWSGGNVLGALDSLNRWSRDLDDVFGRALGPMAPAGLAVDVREEGEDLVLEAEVPGLTRDHINITVENGVLQVTAEYKSSADEKKDSYHIRERRTGTLSRSFKLPNTADADKIAAGLANGVLTLRIPTREEAKPRKIEVK